MSPSPSLGRLVPAVSSIALALFSQSCRHGAPAPGTGARSAELTERAAKLVAEYLEEQLRREPSLGRELGLHEYDGKVAPVSEREYSDHVASAKKYLERISQLELGAVEDPTRLDLELSRLDAERTIFRIETLGQHRHLLVHRDLFDVSGYLVRDYAPLAERVSSMLDHLEAGAAQVEPMLAMLDRSQPRTHLETSKKAFGGLAEYFDGDVKQQSEPALAADPALRARYDRVMAAAHAAVARILRWVDETGLPAANDDFALGEERFLRMLEVNEGLKISLPELEVMAQADFQRNYDAFVATAKRIDPTLSVQEVVKKVAAEHLPADQVLPTAAKQLEDLLAFIEKNDIITIGAEDRATVAVTPPFMRWNSAFLDMAGAFEKAAGSYYYISPPDPSWPKEMQLAYLPYAGDLLSTSIHEVYPGHFVHGLHQRRTPTLGAKLLESYAFVEGWAHYAEEMMFEAGFGRGDARLELGQLSNALLRNCRFLAAIGLHTRGMTVEQANALFQEKCFIDPGNALQQAYRGTFDPGYLSYTLGKLQIMELRKEFFAKRGTTSLRAFHDWLLSFGAPPVALVRERL
ncbi:DUF885 domain-containing protein [Myxococcota bacterium]|nr:DUF885 domain-containing protein [Myxococcota bacterium]